jgi:hypothetical protein
VTCTIKREGEYAVIRIPMQEVQSFRVALEECPCKSAKSVSTATFRQRLVKGLGRLL